MHEVGFLFLFLGVGIEFIKFQFDESQPFMFGLFFLVLLLGLIVPHCYDLF